MLILSSEHPMCPVVFWFYVFSLGPCCYSGRQSIWSSFSAVLLATAGKGKKCYRAKVILFFACSIFSLSSSSQVHQQWVCLLGLIWGPERSELLHNLVISARHNLSIYNLTSFFFFNLTWLLSLASRDALKSHLEYGEAVLYDKSCSSIPKLSIQIHQQHQQRDQMHPQQAVGCSQHAWGMKFYPDRPREA